MSRPDARPTRADARLAAGCLLVAVAGLLLLPLVAQADPGAAGGVPEPGAVAWWAGMFLLGAQAVVLAWRRRRPEMVTVAVAAAVPVAALAGLGAAIGLTSIAVLVAVYTLASRRDPAAAWPVLTAAGVLVATGHAVAGLRDDVPAREAVVTGGAQAVVLVVAAVAVAVIVATRRESISAREDRLRALEREHDALVQAAVARERTAMARELHDIAAHHLTGIAVMSAAIATQIDSDPAAAKAGVGEVRRQSTAVLRDLRGLVGLLRDHDGTTAEAGVRVETVAGIPDLVGQAVAAGQDISLTVLAPADGGPPADGLGPPTSLADGVGPLAQLAAYRTVQESLANAGRHAPGAACEVEVDDRDPAALVVTVRNTASPQGAGPGSHGGLGLVGMQERADLTGSRLDVGPTPDGHWQVRLRTPRADGGEPT